ncbi:MAG: RNase P modulator RnpM [Chloroflexota bacterium]
MEEGSADRGGGVVAGASAPTAPRRTPDRTCVACRTVRPKRDLQRIVRTPAGDIIADDTGRAAGRGAYVCRTGTCLETALAKGALSRALKAPLPPEVRARLAGSITTNTTKTDDTMTIEGGISGQE